jgi:hypothetical protein
MSPLLVIPGSGPLSRATVRPIVPKRSAVKRNLVGIPAQEARTGWRGSHAGGSTHARTSFAGRSDPRKYAEH